MNTHHEAPQAAKGEAVEDAWRVIHVLTSLMRIRPLTPDEQDEMHAAHVRIREAAAPRHDGGAVLWELTREDDASFPRYVTQRAKVDEIVRSCGTEWQVNVRPLVYGDTTPPRAAASEKQPAFDIRESQTRGCAAASGDRAEGREHG